MDDLPCGIFEPVQRFAGHNIDGSQEGFTQRRVQVIVITTVNVERRLIVSMSGRCSQDAVRRRDLAGLMARLDRAETGNMMGEIVAWERAAVIEPAR
jgi:hypothetical protein